METPINIRMNPNEPCSVCGSGKLLRNCCLTPQGTLRIKTPHLIPRSPVSGIACRGCYLQGTNDCSDTLTAEHYMSKTILSQLSGIRVSGMPWLPTGTSKEIGLKALTARILCDHHNSTMTALDDHAGRIFKRLNEIWIDTDRRSLSRKQTVTFFSGETLERWLLKALCGAYYSKTAAKEGRRLIETHELNTSWVLLGLLYNVWQPRCGLYVKGALGENIAPLNGVQFAPLSPRGLDLVVGCQMNLAGITLRLIFDPICFQGPPLDMEGWNYRISDIRFNVQKRAHLVALTWSPGTPSRSLTCTYKM